MFVSCTPHAYNIERLESESPYQDSNQQVNTATRPAEAAGRQKDLQTSIHFNSRQMEY